MVRPLADQAAAEADGDRMGTAPGLELREQMPNMALHRLLREEQANPDLPVNEPVGDQLENLDLARRRFLLELRHRRLERDHLSAGVTASSDRFKAGRVLAIPGQDGIALCGVHDQAIDRPPRHL
jgi:hypothetical protein